MGWEPALVNVMRNRVPSAVAGYFSISICSSTRTYSTVMVSGAAVLDSTPRTVYWAAGERLRSLLPMEKTAWTRICSPAKRVFFSSMIVGWGSPAS